ncbi:MAG TPA: FliH/SctL family protein [Solirubrobacteraceae bacterium]|nr:FliH/SctL family protein [Solirubrobacteraceae bacterium]
MHEDEDAVALDEPAQRAADGVDDALVTELGGIEHCGVEADRRVGRGGAIVRTSEGEIDATLETKLSRAREVVEHELGG